MVKTRRGGGIDVPKADRSSVTELHESRKRRRLTTPKELNATSTTQMTENLPVMLYLLRNRATEAVQPIALRTRRSSKLSSSEVPKMKEVHTKCYKICNRPDYDAVDEEGEAIVRRWKTEGKIPADFQLIKFPINIPLLRVRFKNGKIRVRSQREELLMVNLGNREPTLPTTSRCCQLSRTTKKRRRGGTRKPLVLPHDAAAIVQSIEADMHEPEALDIAISADSSHGSPEAPVLEIPVDTHVQEMECGNFVCDLEIQRQNSLVEEMEVGVHLASQTLDVLEFSRTITSSQTEISRIADSTRNVPLNPCSLMAPARPRSKDPEPFSLAGESFRELDKSSTSIRPGPLEKLHQDFVIPLAHVLHPSSEGKTEMGNKEAEALLDLEESFSTFPELSQRPTSPRAVESWSLGTSSGSDIEDSAPMESPFQLRAARLRSGMKERGFKRGEASLETNPPHFQYEIEPMKKPPLVVATVQCLKDGPAPPAKADLTKCPNFSDLLSQVVNRSISNGVNGVQRCTSMAIMADVIRLSRIKRASLAPEPDGEVAGPSSALRQNPPVPKAPRKVSWAPILERKKTIPVLLGQPLGDEEETVTMPKELDMADAPQLQTAQEQGQGQDTHSGVPADLNLIIEAATVTGKYLVID